jgi:hypothetical protein
MELKGGTLLVVILSGEAANEGSETERSAIPVSETKQALKEVSGASD